MKKIFKTTAIITVTTAALMTTACNTIEGVGSVVNDIIA